MLARAIRIVLSKRDVNREAHRGEAFDFRVLNYGASFFQPGIATTAFRQDDQALRFQLADSGARVPAERRHLRSLDGGEGQHRTGAGLCVQGGRVWVLHLLEERGQGKCAAEGIFWPNPESNCGGFWFSPSVFQEGDVIELCQVSDIRAGGIPIVSVLVILRRYGLK